jgi:hypothetical protein
MEALYYEINGYLDKARSKIFFAKGAIETYIKYYKELFPHKIAVDVDYNNLNEVIDDFILKYRWNQEK